jgi:diaminohydroxyphosphoribosylaminopyrimidine deaminase/5-amino-6-(5-phosphoribosylamino)uracil reductase
VSVDIGVGREAARALNIGFFSRMVRGTPWVRMKAASSLDGRTALPNGVSQWITSVEARTDGHSWRACAGAVLTGIGTVLEDDPELGVRLVESPRQPALVIVDSRLQTPVSARLWRVAGRRVVLFTANTDRADHQQYLDRGAEVIVLPNASGKVDLAAAIRELGKQEINELHVEAGHKLNGSLLREQLVDELLLYQAPLLMGEGAGIAAIGPFAALDDSICLRWLDMRRVGPDLRLRAVIADRDRF